MVFTTAIVSPTALLFPPARVGEQFLNQKRSFLSTPRNVAFHPVVGLKPLGLRWQTNAKKSSASPVLRMNKRASMTCSASMSATCAVMQTQTVVENRLTIENAPTKDSVKFDNNGGDTPKLDDDGGNPPYDGGGGRSGGGGGGGKGPFYGGFYLFLFLAFVTWLDEEAEKSRYIKNHRKRFMQEY